MDLGCITCGSYENWEIQRLKRHNPENTEFTYEVKCLKCGRVIDWTTDNPDAVPERSKIREELLTPVTTFNSEIPWQSDTVGFDRSQLKPRLPKQVDSV